MCATSFEFSDYLEKYIDENFKDIKTKEDAKKPYLLINVSNLGVPLVSNNASSLAVVTYGRNVYKFHRNVYLESLSSV